MKTLIKSSMVAALALAMATFTTSNAQARGWPIAAGVVGGLAVGTAVGVAVASANAPVYTYPAAYYYPVYPNNVSSLAYPAPVPVVQMVAPPPVYVPAPAPVYYTSPVVYSAPYAYGYPYARFGLGWGRGWGWGYPRHFAYHRR